MSSTDLAIIVGKRFIQRRNVRAVQFIDNSGDVGYVPDYKRNEPIHGWQLSHIVNHLNGEATYGHYLLDDNSYCRVFCFDIDLKKSGFYIPDPFTPPHAPENHTPIAFNPRESWADRAHPSREWTKYQMSHLARNIAAAIRKTSGTFGIPIGTAAAYSGNKGIHVYGFIEPTHASTVRTIAKEVLDSMGCWELIHGDHIYKHRIDDPFIGYPNFSLELYPKQDSLDGKNLGNLLRLPLGRHLNSPSDPTFFIDFSKPISVLAPHPNPLQLLETGDPWLQ